MKPLRYYINLIEDDNDMHVYHGGSYRGGDYNPNMKGEPGNIRPLGKGIYTAITPNHAQMYVKYAPGNGQVTKFKVDKSANIYPYGGAAWREESAEKQDWWRNKSKEIQQEFEKKNLVTFNTFRKAYNDWEDTLSNSRVNPELVRQTLVQLGIDGTKQVIDTDVVEIVFYNTRVLIPVKSAVT